MAARIQRPIDWNDPFCTVTVHEASDRMRMSAWYLYKMLKKGTAPPPTFIGTSPRFRAVDVVRWLENSGENSPANVSWLAALQEQDNPISTRIATAP